MFRYKRTVGAECGARRWAFVMMKMSLKQHAFDFGLPCRAESHIDTMCNQQTINTGASDAEKRYSLQYGLTRLNAAIDAIMQMFYINVLSSSPNVSSIIVQPQSGQSTFSRLTPK